ncbi:hypothetical protein [Actinophytocola xinjiangensis]|uniref:hypothetical protein n=1 Tax=Actinophytocola xinjiangensis TaxID=485602 RepID=UPI000ACFA38A|nr:hypothetical protein [Actinophytocola xinjiangensis]
MRRVLPALVSACCLTLVACGGEPPGGSETPPLGGSRLLLALDRVAATEDTRAWVTFDDTAALVELAGAEPGVDEGGHGSLRGYGAANLAPYVTVIEEQPGIALLDADFTVSAGQPPHLVGLVAGGQDGTRISEGLTGLGWTREEQTLVAPALGEVDDARFASLTLQLAKARAEGSDLVYGGVGADLARIGEPTGETLADDPRTRALSDCLGDVVVAAVATPNLRATPQPTAVAVGVRAPSANTDTPHAVVCTSWSSESDAEKHHSLLDKAMSDGASGATREPWSDLFADVTTDNLGGDQHVVSWDADTPGKPPTLVMNMLSKVDLPGFPCQGRMTPEMARELGDYC